MKRVTTRTGLLCAAILCHGSALQAQATNPATDPSTTPTTIPATTPATAPTLEWESYAVQWGQIVTEGDVPRPGINTIFDTLTVRDDGTLARHIMWRDLHGAWMSFTHRMGADGTPLQEVQRSDDGDLTVFDWLPDGRLRSLVFDADSAMAVTTLTDRPAEARSTQRSAQRSAQTGFAPGQYGLEFRAVPFEEHRGRVWIDSSGGPAGWVDYSATIEPTLANRVDLTGPFLKVRTGEAGRFVSEYWIARDPPWIAKVRFEQAGGSVTEWVMVRREVAGG